MLREMTPSLPSLVLTDLFHGAARLREETGWEPFRPGVRIRRLYTTGDNGPAAAFLWYDAGSATPAHEHLGYEHIFVLEGSQSDESGEYPAGTFVVNRPGKTHRVVSQTGCLVLIVWEKGVRFLS
jgi:anti-sigma factor ChrR (cupin superfamily)